MKTKSDERIDKMRNGEHIKCPRCTDGFISAVGEPSTTNVFRCNHCKTGIVLTVPMNKETN